MRKYLSFLTQIIKCKALSRRVPILVTLCVTRRCNLNCRYCYNGPQKDNREFSTAELFSLIDTLAAMGTKYISLNGGEALIREDIEELAKHIRRKKMIFHLSSNGLLIPEKIRIMGLFDSIAISIDGDDSENDSLRGKGTHAKVIEALDALRKEKKNFHLHSVLSRNNIDSMDYLLQLAAEYNTEVQFSFIRENDTPDKTIILEDNDLQDACMKLIQMKKKGNPVFFSARAYMNVIDWPFPYEMPFINRHDKLPGKNECVLKKHSCHIEADGSVYPCVVLVNKFKASNFLDEGFEKSWENIENCMCGMCYNVCCHDLNGIFALKPETLLNSSRIGIQRIFRKTQ